MQIRKNYHKKSTTKPNKCKKKFFTGGADFGIAQNVQVYLPVARVSQIARF